MATRLCSQARDCQASRILNHSRQSRWVTWQRSRIIRSKSDVQSPLVLLEIVEQSTPLAVLKPGIFTTFEIHFRSIVIVHAAGAGSSRRPGNHGVYRVLVKAEQITAAPVDRVAGLLFWRSELLLGLNFDGRSKSSGYVA